MKAKPGTKFGVAALAVAVAFALGWFVLNARVGIPEDRTIFVFGWVLVFVLAWAFGFRGLPRGRFVVWPFCCTERVLRETRGSMAFFFFAFRL